MSAFRTTEDAVVWRGAGETVVVQAWGADSLRVRATRQGDVVDSRHALLEPAPSEVVVRVEGDGAGDEVATLTNGGITATLTAAVRQDVTAGYPVPTCRLRFSDEGGRTLLEELGGGGSLKLQARRHRPLPGGRHHVTASFEATPGERLHGMGQYQQPVFDLKGSTLELAHRNSQASVPFLLSSLGYGLLWHDPAIGRATFGHNRTEWVAECTGQLDYWVTCGGTPARVLAAYANATGHVPPMPEHGLGLWQSKLRYWNAGQLLEVAREHRRRGLPLDVLVADFFHWPRMGDFRFDEEFWPDPRALVAELRALGVELMVSVWPQVALDSENAEEFTRDNLLVRTERGPAVQMAFQGPSLFADMTEPRTRQRVWELCKENYADLGVRTFWLDEAEPEYGVYDFDNYRYAAGPVLEVGNLYPQAFSRAFYEGQRSTGQEEVVNLVRCAWAGSQRYGALVWSGDIDTTWAALRTQVVAGLQMGLAGIPWWTTDTGGFHGGTADDPAYRELLVRWFQFATFCPVLRMHGDRRPTSPVVGADGTPRCPTGADNELWSYGDDVYAVLVRHLRVREALRPYLRTVMAEAHTDGQPVMRPLFHGFPADDTCWQVDDQYLFGPDLLVAPVLRAGATSRPVYLPPGTAWYDAWTGLPAGDGWVEAAAPLERVPVFTRDRALLGAFRGG